MDHRKKPMIFCFDEVPYLFSIVERSASTTTPAEIIAPLSCRSLEAFREQPWRSRGASYESMKKRITQALLEFVGRQHQGLGALVEYAELGTPLTFEHFIAAASGAIYGFPGTPARFSKS